MSGFVERFREEVEKLGGIAPVANDLGVARNTIYNWMAKGNVPLNNLMQLVHKGLDLNYVMTGERSASTLTSQKEQAGYTVEVLSKEEHALLDNYRNSPDVGKRAVDAAVAAVATQEKPKRKIKM